MVGGQWHFVEGKLQAASARPFMLSAFSRSLAGEAGPCERGGAVGSKLDHGCDREGTDDRVAGDQVDGAKGAHEVAVVV